MQVPSLISDIHASAVGEWMRSSLLAMPVVEALHVFAATTVFGSILVVDLRLLGLAGADRPYTRISDEMIRLTWVAFAVAALAGALMFCANANTYFVNTAFRLKMLALLGAGINMAVFQGITRRGVAAWDAALPPLPARMAGAISLLLWITVIVLARWIGFTKGYDFSVPDDPNIKFEF